MIISLSLSHTEWAEWGYLDCLLYFLIFNINKNVNGGRREKVFLITSYNLKDEKVNNYLQNLILSADIVTANIFPEFF